MFQLFQTILFNFGLLSEVMHFVIKFTIVLQYNSSRFQISEWMIFDVDVILYKPYISKSEPKVAGNRNAVEIQSTDDGVVVRIVITSLDLATLLKTVRLLSQTHNSQPPSILLIQQPDYNESRKLQDNSREAA